MGPPITQDLILTKSQVYICRDFGWEACEHVLSKWGNSTSDTYCLQLDGEASAVGPDPGLECVLYSSVSNFQSFELTTNTLTDPSTAKAPTPSNSNTRAQTGSDLSTGMTRQRAISATGWTDRSLLVPRQALRRPRVKSQLLLLVENMVATK